MRPQLFQRPSGRWWTALAVALAVLVVARTNTVDAPADAMTIGPGGPESSSRPAAARAPVSGFTLPGAPDAGDSTRYLWTLESEIRALESELAVERARAELLQESYGALEEKFLLLTAALPLLVTDSERNGRPNGRPNAGSNEDPNDPTNPSVSTGPSRSGLHFERNPR